MEDISALWQTMIDVGYNVRKNGQNGLIAWQPYKNKYADYVFENGESKILLRQDFVDFVRQLNYQFADAVDHTDAVLIVNGDVLDNTMLTHHFIVQHFRIPIIENNNLSVFKLAQLAYNVGQAKAVRELEYVYSPTIMKFYSENNLDNFRTYVPHNCQKVFIKE